MNTEPQNEPIGTTWVMQDFWCSRCGGSLRDGYQERHHGRDEETGYMDVELVCVVCCEKEGAEEDDFDGPDPMDVAHAAMELEDSSK